MATWERSRCSYRASASSGALLLIGLALAACGATQTTGDDFSAYRQNLRQMYIDGMDALDDGNYAEAKKLFQALSGESRYVGYSVLAKLRLGDTMLAEGDYEAAEYVYDEFLQQYRGDPNEAYAHFRKCQTMEERIPGDWVILPPPESKDMTHARRANVCMREFLSRFPDSRFRPLVDRSYAKVREMLYKHEKYVADYYWRHDGYTGMAGRAIGILHDYPEFVTEELYFRLVVSLVEARDLTRATEYFKEYTSAFPEGHHAGDLRARLDDLSNGDGHGKADGTQPAG